MLGNTAILRAVMGITIGIYVYLLSQSLKSILKSVSSVLKSLIQIVLFCGALGFALLKEEGGYDFFFLIVFACALVFATDDHFLGKLADTRIIRWLSKISYCMYLSHFAAIFFLSFIWDPGEVWFWGMIPIYICITLILAIIYSLICDRFRKTI